MPEITLFLHLLMCTRCNACSVQHPPETQLCSALSYRSGQENAARFHKRSSQFHSRQMLEINILYSACKIRMGQNLFKHGLADTTCGSP